MGELLPTLAARDIREGLYDYLETTFSLSDQAARTALEDFLRDSEAGIFKGPYLRTRLPFLSAPDGWREALDWHPVDDDKNAFAPYEHQARAFERLSTARQDRPLPTLVTTGTGSGKTEAFLYPILDHVLRAKRRGVNGTKALILYPMNALADDQAQRIAELITSLPSLGGVTAGVYTGQAGPKRTVVSADSLITSREVMRSSPPDILLTNYKMLDQLLLRHEDAAIWEKSAQSLQYLVLDEFHSYDGAQGTDVAMLLRRLGMTLKAHGATGDRPLGQITPVATSATLGDGGDPLAMLEFAKTVFGEEFPPDAVVTETRVSVEDWFSGDELPAHLQAVQGTELAEHLSNVDRNAEAASVAGAALSALYDGDSTDVDAADLVRCHPLTRLIAEMAVNAEPISSLAALAFPKADSATANDAIETFAGLLSHLRHDRGRAQLSIELHLWVRELTRIDREASTAAAFSWSDDGDDLQTAEMAEAGTDVRPSWPAVYCRSCGRSGWMVLLSPANDTDLARSDETIRAAHMNRQGRTRPLLLALTEGELALGSDPPEEPNLRWFDVNSRQVVKKTPTGAAASDGTVLPIMTHTGDDAEKHARAENCPSCGQRDSIRFLGSAVATQLSVALTTLFGSTTLDPAEKKTLIFTDSVQDAAHRAGFIQARSHSLTVRSFLREAVGDVSRSLDELAQRVIDNAGDDQVARYRILPTELADRDEFRKFWEAKTLAKVPIAVKKRVAKRVAFDATLEFGLQSQLGRTLETTGTVAAEVQAARGLLLSAARGALGEAGGQLDIDPPADEQLVGWARGTLEQIRERGGIEHPWLEKLIKNDGNRHFIWRGRPRSEGMPAFPIGRMAPSFPRSGSKSKVKDSLLDAVAGPTGWYAQWTARCIRVPPAEAAVLARLLISKLAQEGLLTAITNDAGAEVYSIPAAAVTIAPIDARDLLESRHLLECSQCQRRVNGSMETIRQLGGMPCTTARCGGVLEPRAGTPDNFYRKYYNSLEVQRVIAREHTSLLDDKTRVDYENGFKGRGNSPDAPNVLVATPTLEMGIDIGDLTTVMLASLPKSVASYVQRVGRAGRLTGSSMNLAFVPGRPDNLPVLSAPLELINGAVRPPATYLGAEEILHRQFLASLADAEARDPDGCHPTTPTEALGSFDEATYLRSLAERGENDGAHLEKFLEGFDGLPDVIDPESLTAWVHAPNGPATSPLALRILEECKRWREQAESLNFRIKTIEANLPALEEVANLPAATDEDQLAYRHARSAHKLAIRQRKELKGTHWIRALESAGLFPNYTLFDDSVTLDVSLSRLDPDTGLYESTPERYQRGATAALREFAPGATFYAGGLEIKIDAVDLGKDGDRVRVHAFCSACGHNQEVLEEGAPASCPRCGSEAIADVGQHLSVVELDRVSAMMRRDEASINDARDERERKQFLTTLVADFEPSDVVREWYIKDQGFGIKHIKKAKLCWLNLGENTLGGTLIEIAGRDFNPKLFRLCRECGQLDRQTGGNAPTEHRPWCGLRKAPKEETVSVALSHRMETEALMVRLAPWTGVGSQFEVPSLAAAIKLGLTEHLGGAPDHLEVAITSDPSEIPDEPDSQVLLLHDRVPGGTGYLAELADPDRLRKILLRAYEIVRDCECVDQGKLACHKCLLPHAGMGYSDSVSRATAEKLLRDVLLAGQAAEEPDAAATWNTVGAPLSAFDPESALEKRFRSVLADRLRALGATMNVTPTTVGDEWSIQHAGRSWKLEPQVLVSNCKPDFVLRCSDPEVPPTAIFCDGWQYHASPGNNRLADDAEKRQGLRDLGYQVLALTWSDLDDGEDTAPRPWLTPEGEQTALALSDLKISPKQIDLMRRGPLELLVSWIENPNFDALKDLARAISYVLAPAAKQIGETGALKDGQSIVDAAVGCLESEPGLTDGTGETAAWCWRDGSMVAVCSRVPDTTYATNVALVLDDTVDLTTEGAKESWRHWLELSNLLGCRDIVNISVRSQAGSGRSTTPQTEPEGADDGFDPLWASAIAQATPDERAILEILAQEEIAAPGEAAEVHGIPLSTTWPEAKVTIDVDLADEERVVLEKAGWNVVECDAVSIRNALNGSGS